MNAVQDKIVESLNADFDGWNYTRRQYGFMHRTAAITNTTIV
jgi:hypothetical protein